tara:strand:- start:74 stop:1021 length:948 start_codon:yes stop_codon:yes gene_type:complete
MRVFLFTAASFAVALAMSGQVHAGESTDIVENDSLIAPEVQDVDDPFRRGLDRIADQATGGVELPSPSGDTNQQDPSGADLLGKPTESALLSNRYRVIGVAVSNRESRAQIFAATNQDVMPGNKPKLPYARLGLFADDITARQLAIDLKNTSEDLLGAHFILRDEGEDGLILDIGPLRNVMHAERYCEVLLNNSFGLVEECYAALEFPGLEPTDTFTSTAMLRASATAVRSVIKDSTLFDLDTSARRTMTLREGDELGASRATLVKVTPNGVIVVAENGDIATMSIDYLPERAFDINDVSTGVEAAASDPSATDS